MNAVGIGFADGSVNSVLNTWCQIVIARKRILIVDDHPQLRISLCRLLEQDYDVISTSSGRVALELCAQQSFDMLITDLEMAPMNGLDLIAGVRRNSLGTKVILMTGSADAKNLLVRSSCSIDYLMKKPFDKTEMLRTVKELLR